MKIIIVGRGRMGKMIAACAEESGIDVAGLYGHETAASLAAAGKADALIDFSAPAALPAVAEFVRRTGTPLVSGTTGYNETEEAELASLADAAPVVVSANYSVGVAVLKHLVAEAVRCLPDFDVEIVETHHRMKKDAPSGTAKMLLSVLNPDGDRPITEGRSGFSPRTENEIGVHAVRGGTVAGVHTVSFFGADEEVSLTHRAENRRIFALGALKAAQILATAAKGQHTFEDLLFSQSAK